MKNWQKLLAGCAVGCALLYGASRAYQHFFSSNPNPSASTPSSSGEVLESGGMRFATPQYLQNISRATNPQEAQRVYALLESILIFDAENAGFKDEVPVVREAFYRKVDRNVDTVITPDEVESVRREFEEKNKAGELIPQPRNPELPYAVRPASMNWILSKRENQ